MGNTNELMIELVREKELIYTENDYEKSNEIPLQRTRKRSEKKQRWNLIKTVQVATIILLLAFMEYAVRSGGISQVFLASPSQIVEEFLYMHSHGLLWEHVIISLQEFFVGYLYSIILGIGFGLFFVLYPKVEEYFGPFCSAIMSIPKSAILPLLIIWFGIGFQSKVILIVLFCMFTILFNTTSGAKQTKTEHIKVARVFQATKLQTLTNVMIPSALPSIFTGLRVSSATAFTSVIFAEMTASKKGVGYLLNASQQVFNTPRLFVVIVIVTILSVTLVQLVNVVEYFICRRWA